MARARDVWGPYELHPDAQILTARHRPDAALQRAGHADLVETPDGETWMVYLCGRPLRNRGRCTLGRETAIQPMAWSPDGWLRTRDGQGLPAVEVPAPELPPHPFPARAGARGVRRPAAADRLPVAAHAARRGPVQPHGPSRAPPALRARDHRQPVPAVARRPPAAGLPRERLHEARVRARALPADGGPRLLLRRREVPLPARLARRVDRQARARDVRAFPTASSPTRSRRPNRSRRDGRSTCGVEIDDERLLFAYRVDGKGWRWLPQVFDASILSDEASAPGLPNFTGAFVGMACQDMAGTAHPADFDWFEYRERGFVRSADR